MSKRIIWAYSFTKKKKKKDDGILLFLTAFSWETDLCVTLGNFAVKNATWIGKGNLYLTANRLSRNEL